MSGTEELRGSIDMLLNFVDFVSRSAGNISKQLVTITMDLKISMLLLSFVLFPARCTGRCILVGVHRTALTT